MSKLIFAEYGLDVFGRLRPHTGKNRWEIREEPLAGLPREWTSEDSLYEDSYNPWDMDRPELEGAALDFFRDYIDDDYNCHWMAFELVSPPLECPSPGQNPTIQKV